MYTADDATAWHLHTDLVVVGSSGGGLLAALAAAGQGCRVVVLERTKELGGGLSSTRGMIPAAGTRFQRQAGIQDTAEAFESDVLAHSHQGRDPARTKALCAAAAALVEWLAAGSIAKIDLVPALVARGHTAPRLHVHRGGTGAALAADLISAATTHRHITVRTGSVVEDLWGDREGAVVGVAARERRGPLNIRGRRVLLACGGFAAHNDLVAEHQQELAAFRYFGNPGALGDGLRWGITLGAATEHLGACWVAPLVTTPGGLVVPDSITRTGGILVNQLGQRFVNETDAPMAIARAVLAQPGKLAYLLFDDRVYRGVRESDPYFAKLIGPRAVRRDANPADLARHLEIDPDNLIPTLDGFHAGVVHRTDAFGRTDAGPAFGPPFYGARVTPARVRTLGGLRVGAGGEVMRPDGSAVLNLYASGGVVADLLASNADEYPIGGTEFATLVQGWLAGQSLQPDGDA
jgi:fumarate reductase flavoprotein subunit